MEGAGLTVRRDAVGNMIGRTGGDGPPFVLGSHLDTVPNAGRYDGPLGILAALAVVERLTAGGTQPPVPLEVVAFADEEGTRFGTSYLGSAAYTGGFEREWLDLVDADGITVADAILAAGGDPEAAVGSPAPQLAGYLEVHIEQGPVLEREGVPVGVVSAIAGQTRVRVVVRGESGHAGTVPMSARRDALAAAAEIVLAAEHVGRSREGLVATVGALALSPDVGNVVPGEVRMLLEVRHADGPCAGSGGRRDPGGGRADRVGPRRRCIVDASVRHGRGRAAIGPAASPRGRDRVGGPSREEARQRRRPRRRRPLAHLPVGDVVRPLRGRDQPRPA